jgi:hypothetical protein
MYLYCPKCHAQHPAAGRCPKCSSLLMSPGEAADALSVSIPSPPDPVETTYAGRLGVGCVVALGLHVALREWTTAALGAAGQATDPVGFTVGYLLRLFAAGVGGAMAGAGRRWNFTGGAVVGALSGVAWLLVDSYPTIIVDPLRGGLVGVITVAAGLVAMAAGQVWPEPVVVPDTPSPRGSSLMGLKPTDGKRRTGRPTRWVQIAAAAALALGGIAGAEMVRSSLRGLPAGLLQLGGPSAASRVDFQLTVLAVLVASAVAGAGTGAGGRHGLYAGILTALGVLALRATAAEEALPGLDWLAEATCAPDTSPRVVEVVLAGVALLAMTVGGWLGGQLFPPLKQHRLLYRERY